MTKELPKFRSHKVVSALQIQDVKPAEGDGRILYFEPPYDNITVSREVIHRYKPIAGDYYVRYDDGYESISPRTQFEEGYTPDGGLPAQADGGVVKQPAVGDIAAQLFEVAALPLRTLPSPTPIVVGVHDEPGAGGASHVYSISGYAGVPAVFTFQNGPVKEVAGWNGVTNEALLAIVADRLEGFQNGKFKCKENEAALGDVLDALKWLEERTVRREAAGTEGTHTGN